MMTQKLIERLEQILPGLQNSNSAAEVAMVEALPDVIEKLKSYSAPALHRLLAERDAMAEALFPFLEHVELQAADDPEWDTSSSVAIRVSIGTLRAVAAALKASI
jgi:hypothetical protein